MLYNFDDLSFRIFTIDRFVHRNGFFKVEGLPYSAFSLRVNGSGAFQIGNKHFVTQKGDVTFLPANIPYTVEYSNSEIIFIHFEHCNYKEAENICLNNSAEIGLLFTKLLESWNERHSVNRAKSIIYKILEKIEKDKRSVPENSPFANCISYMEKHFSDPQLDIPEVCSVGFISASSLQRAFNAHFGLSPKKYLLNLRLNRALELLTENELSIKEIAFACGFKDEKYFSRAFKGKYGYPPSRVKSNVFV